MKPRINGPRATPSPATRPETSVNHYRRNFDTKGSIQANPLRSATGRRCAIRIQLSRTDYDKAVRRYESTSDWIEQNANLLRGSLELIYPQRSMAHRRGPVHHLSHTVKISSHRTPILIAAMHIACGAGQLCIRWHAQINPYTLQTRKFDILLQTRHLKDGSYGLQIRH